MSHGRAASNWQVKLGSTWQDYGREENSLLKRAYLTGQKQVRFKIRGREYSYDFRHMTQRNMQTGKQKQMRPPYRSPRPPAKPTLPHGPMIILTVKAGQPGTVIEVADPNNPGQKVNVYVPAHAKVGAKMAIPLPQKGHSVESVQKAQEKLDAETGAKSGWSTGAKVAAGGAAVAGIAAVGVGGVILGDHLAGGDMAETIGEAAVDAGEAIGDVAGDAAEAVGDFAVDAGEWLGEAAEDAGDFIMDLF